MKVFFDKKKKVFVVENVYRKQGLPDLRRKEVGLRDINLFLNTYSYLNRNEKLGYVVPRRKLLEELAWKELGTNNMCSVDLLTNAFQGGTNRAHYYFPKYYLPMKVLEHKRFIKVKEGKIITSEEKIKEAKGYLKKLRGK